MSTALLVRWLKQADECNELPPAIKQLRLRIMRAAPELVGIQAVRPESWHVLRSVWGESVRPRTPLSVSRTEIQVPEIVVGWPYFEGGVWGLVADDCIALRNESGLWVIHLADIEEVTDVAL